MGMRSSYEERTTQPNATSKHNSRGNRHNERAHRSSPKKKGRGGGGGNVLQCMAPMNYRDSFVVAEMKDRDELSFQKHSQSSISNSHRKRHIEQHDEKQTNTQNLDYVL